VHRADLYGNSQIDGYGHMDPDIAKAAHTVIVTAERLVPTEEIISSPDRTTLPHFLVDAVVEVPLGSYPHECYGLYDANFDHFDSYVSLINQKGEDGVTEFLDDYVFGTGDFEGFLNRFDTGAVVRAQRRAQELAP
jgi:glutaconate CoA-transferase subunit A